MNKKDIIGTWKLIAFELRDPGGTAIEPFGAEGIGIATFDACGYMSAQLMAPQRPSFLGDVPTAEEAHAAYSTFIAYSGRYQVDETRKTLVTRVETALDPRWVGTDQLRYYEGEGDEITLRTPPMNISGVEFTGTLTWQRVRGESG